MGFCGACINGVGLLNFASYGFPLLADQLDSIGNSNYLRHFRILIPQMEIALHPAEGNFRP